MLRALAGTVQTSGVALEPVLQALRLSRALDHEPVSAQHIVVQIHQSKTHGCIWTEMGIRLTQLTTTYRDPRLSKRQPVGAW
jgi:hypothetical protein